MYRLALTLTVNNAKTVLEAGLRAIEDGQTHFDLADLATVDSAAVATMLAWQRAARSGGKTLVFSHVPASLQSLCDLYGVAELLHSSAGAESRADFQHH
ncbi:MAG: STAS domain-containing protein [Noviherbaspirillum sp.]